MERSDSTRKRNTALGGRINVNLSVAPAGSAFFNVYFTPTTEGGFRGNLVINTNNGDTSSPFTFAVQGVGGSDQRFFSAPGTAGTLLDVLQGRSSYVLSLLTDVVGGTATIEAGKVRFTPADPLVRGSFTFSATDNLGQALTETVVVYPLPPAGSNYVGLLRRVDGSVRGRVLLTVSATGIVTGTARRENSAYTLKGTLAPLKLRFSGPKVGTGPATLVPGATDAAGQPTLALSVPDTQPGQLSSFAELSPYDATHAAPQAGRYTILAKLPGGGTGPATGAAMACTIAADGSVNILGKLGNDAPLSFTSRLLTGGRLPFYAGFADRGIAMPLQRMTGEATFNETLPQAVVGTLHWSVPAGVPRLVAGVEQDYNIVGSRYTPPALASGLFTPVAPSATLTLTLDAGAPLVRTINLTNVPLREMRTERFASGNIRLQLATGIFSGTYSASRTDHRRFFGAVLQDTTLDTGAGWLIEPSAISPVTFVP